MIALNGPHKDVGIDENLHLPAVWIKVLAATKRFIPDRSGLWKTVRPLFELLRPFFETEPAGYGMFLTFLPKRGAGSLPQKRRWIAPGRSAVAPWAETNS
jgi:hypothetical protein